MNDDIDGVGAPCLRARGFTQRHHFLFDPLRERIRTSLRSSTCLHARHRKTFCPVLGSWHGQ